LDVDQFTNRRSDPEGCFMNLDVLPAESTASETRKDLVLSTLKSALDSIAVGVITVDRSLRPLHFNRYAAEILEEGGSLALDDGMLTCPQPDDTNRLKTAVTRCIGAQAASATLFRLHDPRRAEPLEVAVKRSGNGIPELATIFIRNSAPQSEMPDMLLADLYGFTRAERQIAALLTQEGSVTLAAKVRGVSASTARTHLRSLLRKTGARRQVDLVQRLSTGLCGLVRFCPRDRNNSAGARRSS